MTRVTHDIHGDQVLVTVEIETTSIVANASGTVSVSMEDHDWRRAARAVLRECNAAEFKLPPEAVVQRVRDALADAAVRAAEAETAHVARLRLASSVLHRVADMVQAGTIGEVDVSWSREEPQSVRVAFSTERRQATILVELGKGVVDEAPCECPPGLLDDRGWQIHEGGCPLGRHE